MINDTSEKKFDTNTVEIAVNLPLDKVFDYSVPEDMRKDAAVGKRVRVDFRNKEEIGYIVGFSGTSRPGGIKPIKSIIDAEPLITDEMMRLCRMISDTYLCSLGEAIACSVPGAIKRGQVSIRESKKKESHEENTERSAHLELTDEQRAACDAVTAKINKSEHEVFLIHGVTSSGKTEVYLQAIQEVLNAGKTSIVLVPEISLTPQTVSRFISRFGNLVAVVHSQLLGSTRFKEWKRIKDGQARIVVGARSAIFSPLKGLGLIVIDEEHETTYKQEDTPRYHAREVAIMRAKMSGCPVVLGSATPSLESYYRAEQGIYKLLRLTKRIDNRPMPKVKVVDMRMELASRQKLVMFSKVLVDELARVLKSGNQSMVFLNRRGFSTYILCRSCGHVIKCTGCDAVMVYHFEKKKLLCHYCERSLTPPNICPKCRSGYVQYFGVGTERVESELAREVPGARIGRMDTDSMSKRGSHDSMLKSFKEHKIDILVGTQMIAKGHDFPNVTLVGLVNSDVSLNIPDFRASERTFGLITQVAGRAGRGEDPGTVIVQTYAPDNYAIRSGAKHDFEAFYKEEIEIRRKFNFPPFTNLVKLTLRSRSDKKVEEASRKIGSEIKILIPGVEMLGPAPAPIARIRGYYRWNILLKFPDPVIISKTMRNALESIKKPSGVLMAVDVDPMAM